MQSNSIGYIIAICVTGILLLIAGFIVIWCKNRSVNVKQVPAEDANEIPIMVVAHPVIEDDGNMVLQDNDGQLIVPLPPPSAPPLDN